MFKYKGLIVTLSYNFKSQKIFIASSFQIKAFLQRVVPHSAQVCSSPPPAQGGVTTNVGVISTLSTQFSINKPPKTMCKCNFKFLEADSFKSNIY